jgi:hypothetical protein
MNEISHQCNLVWGAIYLLFVHTLPDFWSSNVAALCVREPAWWQALSEIISGFRNLAKLPCPPPVDYVDAERHDTPGSEFEDSI